MNDKKVPAPSKSVLGLIGPGLVLIAMGLGSGEFILWPYLVSQFGTGVLWGALIGISLQYFVSNETGRYTLATGDSVFVGFRKLFKFFPHWFILSTFLSFAWPGIIGSGGEILGRLLGVSDFKWLTVLMLLVIGLLFSLGGKVYSTLEKIQKIYIFVTLPLLFLIAVLLINPEIILDVTKGLVGIGHGYFLLPAGISIGQFLGAVAYSGAAGNLLLSHSFYIQDKGLGMAKYSDSQLELGKHTYIQKERNFFEQNDENFFTFKRWFRIVAIEQLVSFLIVGFLMILVLSVIAYSLIYPNPTGDSLSFVFQESEALSLLFSPVLGTLFLIIGVIFLFTTQLGVFESTSRIMSENALLALKTLGSKSRSSIFFLFLWAQIIFAIVITILDVAAPIQILFINTLFSAISMFVLSGAVMWLNNSKIMPENIRPGIIRRMILLSSFIFFGVFSLIAISGV